VIDRAIGLIGVVPGVALAAAFALGFAGNAGRQRKTQSA
jgi:hypothetical protein